MINTCIICKNNYENNNEIAEPKVKEFINTFGKPICHNCYKKIYGKILTNELYEFLYPEVKND